MSRRGGRKLIFTIMLNILFCLLGYVKMDYGNACLLPISCGCCLHHSLWPTYVTITCREKKSIYFLLNYICFIQGFFFPLRKYWKSPGVIILLRKKINLQIMLRDSRDCSTVLNLFLTLTFIFP